MRANFQWLPTFYAGAVNVKDNIKEAEASPSLFYYSYTHQEEGEEEKNHTLLFKYSAHLDQLMKQADEVIWTQQDSPFYSGLRERTSYLDDKDIGKTSDGVKISQSCAFLSLFYSETSAAFVI